MTDSLSTSGYIELILDPLLCSSAEQISTIQTNLTIAITGSSIQSAPSTQIVSVSLNGSQAYMLRLTNLNITSTTIPSQTVTIAVSNLLNCPSVCTLNSFSLSTYYSSSNDLVASANYSGTITLQPGSINLNTVSSTATTTYTFGTISLS